MRFDSLNHTTLSSGYYSCDTGRFGTVGWTSECRGYLLLSIDGSRANNYEQYHTDGQYIRFCTLNSQGRMSSKSINAVCTRSDGATAFVIKEIMDLTSKYARYGAPAVLAKVRRFVKAIRVINKPVGIRYKINSNGHTYLWTRVSISRIQAYLDEGESKV